MIGLKNPLKKDFSDEIFDENNRTINVLIPSKQIVYLPKEVHQVVRRHLANFVLNNRGGVKTNWDDDMAKIYKEVEIIV